jgi:hypothetical protein
MVTVLKLLTTLEMLLALKMLTALNPTKDLPILTAPRPTAVGRLLTSLNPTKGMPILTAPHPTAVGRLLTALNPTKGMPILTAPHPTAVGRLLAALNPTKGMPILTAPHPTAVGRLSVLRSTEDDLNLHSNYHVGATICRSPSNEKSLCASTSSLNHGHLFAGPSNGSWDQCRVSAVGPAQEWHLNLRPMASHYVLAAARPLEKEGSSLSTQARLRREI